MRRTVTIVAGAFALAAALVVLTTGAGAQSDRAIEISRGYFAANRAAFGLADPATELQVRRANRDARGNTHVRFEQFYRGLRVFEGEAIAHVDANGDVTVTSSLHGNLNLDPRPRVGRDAAVATALRSIAPLGASEVRDASLVVLPRGARSIVDRVTWQIVVSVENEFEDPAEWHYFVDASTGEVAYSFNGLETAKGGGKPGGGGGGGGGGAVGPVAGTARTMFSGSQAITVDQTASSTFYLRDPNRGGTGRSGSGNFTCDMRNGQALCYYVTNTSSTFGDNVISTTGLTAAADAHFGLQATWDFYRNTFQRTGIDGVGTQTYSRVHYGRGYENAFWSDSCFCMTYGDGKTSFYPLVSLDVAGHEMSHGVMSTEANLTYSGESGGLNESSSDIFGTLVEYSANNSQDVGDYWIGERILKSNYVNGTFSPTSALRYMDDPAKDGISPACWSDSVGNLNVHYSSGPNNHMFYLLAEGGKSACNGAQVSGIGRAKAGAIWYDAITNHMTASTDYHGARAAALASAATIFGNGSPEYNAVAAAYSAIDVN